ncbi:hypothetical protein LCGC14_1446870, partial [marine sediment metagenome]
NAGGMTLAFISGATFTTIQDLQNIFHSAGWVSGGGITDDADGTITVASGTGLIRATDSATAEILFFDWSAESGANVNLADTDTSYVYVEYNAGSPQVVATTILRTDFNTNILLATIYRDGTDLHINDKDVHSIGDHANNMIRRLKETMPYGRKSGAIITETGVINFALTAGNFWRGLKEFATSAIDTSGADTFSYYQNNGTWQKVTAQSVIDDTQYNNFGVGLATLSNNKYGIHWVYKEADDDDVAVVYGIGDYTLAEAEDAQPPSSVPEHLNVEGILVGKIIIKKSDVVFTQIESAFQTTFQGSLATDHGNLAGLDDDDHTQYVPKTTEVNGNALSGNINITAVQIESDDSGETVQSKIDDADAHIASTSNPHSVIADQIGTDTSGVDVQAALDAVESDVSDLQASALTFIIDGGGAAITTGIKGDIKIPFGCTITKATLLADQSGSIVVDIWKDTYANFAPTNADSITASAPPTITTAVKSEDGTLTGWTTAIVQNDILRYNVDSVTDIERVTLILDITRT